MDFLTWEKPELQDPFDSHSALSLDAARLDEEIAGIVSTRRFLNKSLTAMTGVLLVNGGVHLAAKLGLPALAAGTLGGILFGLFLVNALTKIRHSEGQPSIDSDFFLSLAQAASVGTALWLSFTEHREIGTAAKDGRERFLVEVRAYEVKPEPPSHDLLLTLAISLGGLLLMLGIVKSRAR
ncbi:MAG: hypothetical protein KME32_33565 [Mojavia pulchra JT2-VF2]|jgi:hypothetical protein|uniref:Uncharacterized protein n=1 Tax=Mojavia pulchra JT2-VF2 TaxID=287848 RepID=A0A951Q7D9_9NOST|nr:hypothetical protein [Mojavia pulchra JT2-VF2]